MMRNVVVAGWGQVTQPKEVKSEPLGPLGLMAEASEKAGQVAGAGDVLQNIDGIMVVRIVSRDLPDAAGQLARRLRAAPRHLAVSGIGGHSPQATINAAAEMIARGELDSILVAGAEAYVRREKNPERVESALFRGVPADYDGDDLVGATPLETAHGIEHPLQGFPLFETALWAASGLDLKSWLGKVGAMCSGFSEIAARNPHAWSRTIRTPEEIVTPSADNRPVAFPYTKYMNSFVTVDQGAAVILMAEEVAERHARQGNRRVYFLGGGYAEHRQRFLIQRSDFTANPALLAAVERALGRARMRLEEMDGFDFYSCFPCAVTIAKKMLGIEDHDPRPLTLTGGLGYFGGPGNNYNLHAVATLAEKIAGGRMNAGLVTALGWFMHKHAAGVYASTPPAGPFEPGDQADRSAKPVGEPPPPLFTDTEGAGIIETYTVIYHRDRTPAYAVLYGKTEDGRRFISRTEARPDILRLTTENLVGRPVGIRFDASAGINIAFISPQ